MDFCGHIAHHRRLSGRRVSIIIPLCPHLPSSHNEIPTSAPSLCRQRIPRRQYPRGGEASSDIRRDGQRGHVLGASERFPFFHLFIPLSAASLLLRWRWQWQCRWQHVCAASRCCGDGSCRRDLLPWPLAPPPPPFPVLSTSLSPVVRRFLGQFHPPHRGAFSGQRPVHGQH